MSLALPELRQDHRDLVPTLYPSSWPLPQCSPGLGVQPGHGGWARAQRCVGLSRQAKESIEQLVYLCQTDKEDVREAAKQSLMLCGECPAAHPGPGAAPLGGTKTRLCSHPLGTVPVGDRTSQCTELVLELGSPVLSMLDPGCRRGHSGPAGHVIGLGSMPSSKCSGLPCCQGFPPRLLLAPPVGLAGARADAGP